MSTSPAPLVLDTCVMDDKDLLKWLYGYHNRVVLPSIAFTEYCIFQVLSKKRTYEEIYGKLKSLGIQIEWFNAEHAKRTVEIAGCDGNFKNNSRDYMIASHAYIAPWILVTKNIKDFEFMGDRVKPPCEIMKLFQSYN